MSVTGMKVSYECDVCRGKQDSMDSTGKDLPPGWIRAEFSGPELGIHPAARAAMKGLAEAVEMLSKMGPPPGTQPHLKMPKLDIKAPSPPTAPLTWNVDICDSCVNTDDQWLVMRRALLMHFSEQSEPLEMPAIFGGLGGMK